MDIKKFHPFNAEQAINEDAHEGITAIIPTYNSPPQMFALSIVSLYLNSTDFLNHIIVSINGPDKRTGSTVNQDRKQIFLEKIREYLPITVQRTWSRIGQGQAIDAACSWVHTKNYLIMHDDVLVLNSDWCNAVIDQFQDPSVAVVCYKDSRWEETNILRASKVNGKVYLTFPKLGTEFTAVKKKESSKWVGYWMNGPFEVHTLVNEIGCEQVDVVTYETGAFIRHELEKRNKRIVELSHVIPHDCIYHYGVFTQSPNHHVRVEKIKLGSHYLAQVEKQMEDKLPFVYAFYKRYFGEDTNLISRSIDKISEKSKKLRKNGTGRGHVNFLNRPRV